MPSGPNDVQMSARLGQLKNRLTQMAHSFTKASNFAGSMADTVAAQATTVTR